MFGRITDCRMANVTEDEADAWQQFRQSIHQVPPSGLVLVPLSLCPILFCPEQFQSVNKLHKFDIIITNYSNSDELIHSSLVDCIYSSDGKLWAIMWLFLWLSIAHPLLITNQQLVDLC
jgi:hypothetical protein